MTKFRDNKGRFISDKIEITLLNGRTIKVPRFANQNEKDHKKEKTDRAQAIEVKEPIYVKKSRATAILETIQDTIEENKFEIIMLILWLIFTIIIIKTH